MTDVTIVLRYFDCRARGQALRYLLVDQAVEFSDEIVAADQNWPAKKNTPSFGGPFASLPVLHWETHTVGQTLAIAAYLSRRFGHYGDSAEHTARLESASSSAYLDMTSALSELFRPRLRPQSAQQWAEFFGPFVRIIPGRLAPFERLLAACGTPFFGGQSPVAADSFVFEAVDTWLELLGDRFVEALHPCPRLREQRAAMLERPSIRAYLASGRRPVPFTASPHEKEIRQVLAAHLDAPR